MTRARRSTGRIHTGTARESLRSNIMPLERGDSPQSKLTPHAQLNHVEAVVNAASGSVGPNAAERLEEITTQFGLNVKVRNVQPKEIGDALRAAVDAKPDLLIVLAGDGTAGLAAELCGMTGPLVAPLPGGTMNMLPHALYGRRNWQDALIATLAEGAPKVVSGGEVSGRPFHVAAILGAPALWADAREAMRKHKFRLAFLRARRALARAFSGSLRFSLDSGARRKAEALSLMCPLVSKGAGGKDALEAAALDPHGAADAFRLGVRTLVGGWRDDPCVEVELCTHGRAWAHGRIPILLDGEPHRMDSPVTISYVAEGFRALAPISAPDQDDVAKSVGEDNEKAAVEGSVANQALKSL